MIYEDDDDSDEELLPTPAEINAIMEARRERSRKELEARALLPPPPPPPNEHLWLSGMCKEFAQDGLKDEPYIRKHGNGFQVQFEGRPTKMFPMLEQAIAHRDVKAKEFGIEEDVANKRINVNRLRKGTGTERERLASAIAFLKTKFPDVYASVAFDKVHCVATAVTETGITWNAWRLQWKVQTTVDGTKVRHGDFYLWQLAAAIALRDEKRGYSNKERDERNAKIVATDPMYKDVPFAASNDKLTEWHKTHWTTNFRDADRPHLVVKGTNCFLPACQHVECDSAAKGDGRGGKSTFCGPHGGGRRCWGALGVKGGCTLDCIVADDKYDGMCVRCFCAAKPDDIRAIGAMKHMMAKEHTVRAFLQKAFPEYNWTFNSEWKKLGAFEGRLRVRPDARTMISDRVIIVEIDEHSHAIYDCAKERVREATFVAIAASGGKTVVLLRINPDGYRDEHGRYFPTCFKLSKQSGQVAVDFKQQKQWDGRLAELAERVNFFLNPSNPIPPPQVGRPCHTVEIAYHDVAGNAAKKRSRVEM